MARILDITPDAARKRLCRRAHVPHVHGPRGWTAGSGLCERPLLRWRTAAAAFAPSAPTVPTVPRPLATQQA
jgi:hypothetical protein